MTMRQRVELFLAALALCLCATIYQALAVEIPVDAIRVGAILEDETDDTALDEGQLARVVHDSGAVSLRIGTDEDGTTTAVTDPFSIKVPGERLCEAYELQYALSGNAHLLEDGTIQLLAETNVYSSGNVGSVILTAPGNISRIVYRSTNVWSCGFTRPTVDFLRTETNIVTWSGYMVESPPGSDTPVASVIVDVQEVWVDISPEFRGEADLRTKELWVRTPDAAASNSAPINLEYHDEVDMHHRAEWWAMHRASEQPELDSYGLRYSPHWRADADAQAWTLVGSDCNTSLTNALRVWRPGALASMVAVEIDGTNLVSVWSDLGVTATNAPTLQWRASLLTGDWADVEALTNAWPNAEWIVSSGVRYKAYRIDAVPPAGAQFFRLRYSIADDRPAGIELPATGSVYLGAPTADGTWRIVRSGDDLAFQRRESGAWVSKSTVGATP